MFRWALQLWLQLVCHRVDFGRKAHLADPSEGAKKPCVNLQPEYLLPHSALILLMKTVGFGVDEACKHRAITGSLLPRRGHGVAFACPFGFPFSVIKREERRSFATPISISATDPMCWCLSSQGSVPPRLPRRGRSPLWTSATRTLFCCFGCDQTLFRSCFSPWVGGWVQWAGGGGGAL